MKARSSLKAGRRKLVEAPAADAHWSAAGRASPPVTCLLKRLPTGDVRQSRIAREPSRSSQSRRRRRATSETADRRGGAAPLADRNDADLGAVPDYVGAFRGEPGLEEVQVLVGTQYGVAAEEVSRRSSTSSTACRPPWRISTN